MEHIQHLSFKSLVKMDHFQKKPPPNLNIRFGSKADIARKKKATNFGPLADIGSTRRDVCFFPRKTVRGPLGPVCTENLDSDVVVMKPAKDWLRFDASSALNRTGDWRIFIQ